MTFWRRWVRRPQDLFLRKALFQIHLWTGIGVGLYVFVICVSGSVLVYRNELSQKFTAQPVFVAASGRRMSADELKEAARRAYPAYQVTQVWEGKSAEQAVEVFLEGGNARKQRLFDPYTGKDLGNSILAGFRFTYWLVDFHDNLLYGETGRRINGVGALFMTLLCVTGAIIWWPGIGSWRRSLTIDLKANWKRLTWSLHGALGFWFFGFVLMWGITGIYLSFPEQVSAVADFLEPFDDADPDATRVVDTIQYWLAYLHFGRLGGRGIPGCGRGLCDSTTKLIWAVSGFVPPLMFATGALMWWNRVVRPAARQSELNAQASAVEPS